VQPFFGVNAKEVMRRHMEERPLASSEKLGHRWLPRWRTSCSSFLAKDPESRPPTACRRGDAGRGHRDPILGRWTDEEGDEWWRANAPADRVRQRRRARRSPVKLDVDVEPGGASDAGTSILLCALFWARRPAVRPTARDRHAGLVHRQCRVQFPGTSAFSARRAERRNQLFVRPVEAVAPLRTSGSASAVDHLVNINDDKRVASTAAWASISVDRPGRNVDRGGPPRRSHHAPLAPSPLAPRGSQPAGIQVGRRGYSTRYRNRLSVERDLLVRASASRRTRRRRSSMTLPAARSIGAV
jgi:hypothetical protein